MLILARCVKFEWRNVISCVIIANFGLISFSCNAFENAFSCWKSQSRTLSNILDEAFSRYFRKKLPHRSLAGSKYASTWHMGSFI